jgi:hypothetical protein
MACIPKSGVDVLDCGYIYIPGKDCCRNNIGIKNDISTDDDIDIFKTFIPERRDEFAVLTFPDHEKTLWTDEELLDFRIEPDSVDLVYYTLGKRGTCDLCLLLRMQYKSRPLYAEILYFDNAADANVERAALQSSIVLTYSVQDFIDSVVSCYEYREEYILDSDRWSEEWEVEDRDFIFENMLVHHAIVWGNNNNNNTNDANAKLRRSWSGNGCAPPLKCLCRQSPMLGQLYRGIVSSHREALWGDSKRAVMPALIGRQLSIVNLKERRAFIADMHSQKNAWLFCYSHILQTYIETPMIYKAFVNIIPFYGVPYYENGEGNDLSNDDYELEEFIGDAAFVINVWQYLSEKYSKSYKPSVNPIIRHLHQKNLEMKKKFETTIYPNVSFLSVVVNDDDY